MIVILEFSKCQKICVSKGFNWVFEYRRSLVIKLLIFLLDSVDFDNWNCSI